MNPCLELNLRCSVPLKVIHYDRFMAPDSHTITIGLKGADEGRFKDWYLKGWLQGYYRLKHDGMIDAQDLSDMLCNIEQQVQTIFTYNSSFVELWPQMNGAMGQIVQYCNDNSALNWYWTSNGVEGEKLLNRMHKIDNFINGV